MRCSPRTFSRRALGLAILLCGFGGLAPAAELAFPNETIDTWQGLKRHTFTVDGCSACVVEPKTALPGNPWAWYYQFDEHAAGPIGATQLLARGFFHAHIDVGDTFACPDALKHFDAFYAAVTAQGLSTKAALIGVSRGGLSAYRWASEGAERVSVIYADNPVCDFKSWPGGKGTSGGDPRSWPLLMSYYHFANEAEALAYRGNPIDTLEPLAKAKVALIHVVGDSDDTVPVAENTAIVESRYQALHGTMQVIHKPGGHHPHGLDDPTPVVDFIIAHTAVPAK